MRIKDRTGYMVSTGVSITSVMLRVTGVVPYAAMRRVELKMDSISLIKQYLREYKAAIRKRMGGVMEIEPDVVEDGMEEDQESWVSNYPFVEVVDPWKHRSKHMKCQTCMHFVLKQSSQRPEPPEQGTRIGRCRKHAPTMDGYPVVFEGDWCGDHKLDEEKF